MSRRHLGCSEPLCTLCIGCQKRRCSGNFGSKYLAPTDVLEAKCGAQIYVVVVDSQTGALIKQGLDDAFLQIMLIDAKAWEASGETVDSLDICAILSNKQGGSLLLHGRSGFLSDDKKVHVPLIHGQSVLPDLKVTDSSEALLSGRAPPFRLVIRAVRRGGVVINGVLPAASEPFVVATSRVKGAVKVEIPHVDDHVSKLECVGIQTQKKLEDIAAAAEAANQPPVRVPQNSITSVGQFLELVLFAEGNKPLLDTLKTILRLTKGWDVAAEHAKKAVTTDTQLRVFYPDLGVDIGLLFKCDKQNALQIHRPVGLIRRNKNKQSSFGKEATEVVEIIWLSTTVSSHPDAVRRLLTPAANAWWTYGHPGWRLIALTTSHIPPYDSGGQPTIASSSFTLPVEQSTGSVYNQPLPLLFPPLLPSSSTAAQSLDQQLGPGDDGFTDEEIATLMEAVNQPPLMSLPGMVPQHALGVQSYGNNTFQQMLAQIAVAPPPPPISSEPLQGRPTTSNGSGDLHKRKAEAGLNTPWTSGADGLQIAPIQEMSDATAGAHLSSMFTSLLLNNNKEAAMTGRGVSLSGSQPARRPETITLEEMQGKFAAALYQKISYDELEAWLRLHDLLPPTEAEAAAAISRQQRRHLPK